MRHGSGKPLLTREQAHQKKLDDWRVRRVLRMTQARNQANVASCQLRVKFWTEVDHIAQEMQEVEAERQRIEEELEKKRRAGEERKRQEQLRFMADQEKSENLLREEKKRMAEEYAKRARDRFDIALAEEKRRRAEEQRCLDQPLDSFQQTRKSESQKSRLRAVQIREAAIPETTEISFARRDSMLPREVLPEPTPAESRKVVEKLTLVSPLSTGRSQVAQQDSAAPAVPVAPSEDDTRSRGPVLRPRPLRAKENIPSKGEASKRLKNMSEIGLNENVTNFDREEAEMVSTDWTGSIVDLGKENMEPVPAAFSPWSYSSVSVVSLGGRRMQPVSTMSVATSVSNSSNSTNDSNITQDSETLRSVFQHPAIQFSPPKQPPNPHSRRTSAPDVHPASIRADSTTYPVSSNTSLSKSRRPLRQVENIPPEQKQLSHPVKRKETAKLTDWRPEHPSALLSDLQQVMDALHLLVANVVGGETDSFTLSLSSGPLSTPESGVLRSDESWLSQQTLSSESSFQTSHVTLETGSLYTSREDSVESGPLDLSFPQPGAASRDTSHLSDGNLDERLSVGELH